MLFLALLPSILAAPVYDVAAAPAEGLHPLALALSLLPFPLLAVLKYAYLRFRKGQSIHAVDGSALPKAVPASPVSTPASPALSLHSSSPPPSSFWLALHPYLVGSFGSPDWETIISCRIHKTLRRSKPPSPPLSPVLADSTRTTRTNRSATTAYPTISTKSRATTRSSCSRYLSVSLIDKSRTRLRLPNDFAVMQPASPPLLQLPPPAHLPNASVRFSVQQPSPTLMQIMEPVLSSWYDDSPRLRPPVVLVNDKVISPSTSAESQDKSTSTGDISLSFHTPLTSPRSPGIPWSRSTPLMPFAQLRQQHTLSASSSVLTIGAATIPSPASVSIAVFHSPAVHSIPVPQPIYTPSLRPESCVVLPHDWQQEKENVNAYALLHSPTHCSPASCAPTMYDCLSKTHLSPTPLGTRPLNVLKADRNNSTPTRASLKLTKSPMRSPAISSVHDSTASTGVASPTSDRSKSWDLTALENSEGKLDVDAVSRALGLGAGLGLQLGLTPPASRSSVASASVLSATESESAVSALLSPVLEDEDWDEEGDGEGEDTPSFSGMSGWPGGAQEYEYDGGLLAAGIADMSTHVHGLPLGVIMEETRSEVASVCTRRGREESGVVSMELDSGMGCEIVRDVALVVTASVDESVRPVSGVCDQSWKEGESRRLSVGVAW